MLYKENGGRVGSVDLLRGMIMVIMAIDHVRHFWSATVIRPEDVSQTTVALFFTRWITHLCAPTFALLTGVSIFLISRKKNRRELTVYLLSRGAMLVALQVLVISFLFQFSFDMIILEVIWVLGWSMILMAGLIWLPRWVVGVIGLIVIVGHNLLPIIQPVTLANFPLAMLHNIPSAIPMDGLPTILIAYTVLPCIGIVAVGYFVGPWLLLEKRVQANRWLIVGTISLGVFVVLRIMNAYGDPSSWQSQPRGSVYTVLSFLNVTKYPESLHFLTLTLGVACLFLSLFTFYEPPGSDVVKVYGKVPFFFYAIHFPLISIGAHIWLFLSYGKAVNLGFALPDQWPLGYEPNLVRLYVVWVLYLVILYFPCRWYAKLKARNRNPILSYL